MKKFILVITLLMLLYSCESTKVGDIAQWDDYFVFITSEDADLFNSYPQYDAGKVTFGSSLGVLRSFDFVDTVDNIHRFGWVTFIYEENYIDYGNGDIDTLTMSWEPKKVKVEDVFMYRDIQFKAVDKITFSFNGSTVAVWDFMANPELKEEIPRRNNPSGPSYPDRSSPDFDPVVIVLPKEPDFDELN